MIHYNSLHFLVLGTPSRGHVFPTIELIKSFRKQGCKVTYLNTEPFKKIVETSDATFLDYRSCTLSNVSIPITTMEPQDVTIELQKIFFICALEIMPRLDQLHKENDYDAVIYDQMALWGQLFADKYNLPSFCSNTMFLFDEQQTLRQIPKYLSSLDLEYDQRLNELAQRFKNIKSYKDILSIQTAMRADYIITYYPPNLHKHSARFNRNKILSLGNRFNSANFQSIQEFTDSSQVYVSLGTVFNEKSDLLEKIIKYFSNTKHTLIVSTGCNEGIYQSLTNLKAYKNIQINTFINQLEVLSKSILFITHAGFNSMYEGLYASVPMLMIPHTPEQQFNAGKVEKEKVGYILEEDKISEAYLKIVMNKVKKNWPTLKKCSRKIRHSFINSNDNDVVANKIMRHCKEMNRANRDWALEHL